jgi:hypothetical protein
MTAIARKARDGFLTYLVSLVMKKYIGAISLLLLIPHQGSADPTQLPLISIEDISNAFEGAFKVSHSDSVSTTAWANGRIAYNPVNKSIFLDSHTYEDAIGEFKVPDSLSQSQNTELLPDAELIQGFARVLERPPTGNTQGLDDIGGMAFIEGDLFVQAYKYYDAAATNEHTTLVIRDPNDLASSTIDGYFELNGEAKTANYIAPIPRQWQEIMGGSYLAGGGLGIPINTRLSVGPSLFVFDPLDFNGRSSGNVQSINLLSYSLSEALSTTLYTYSDNNGNWDAYNHTGMLSNFEESNDLWTEASAAWFGFIIPGTRTFVVLGISGMHESGGGYKITQTDGNVCGGPCAKDPDDKYPYYWLYDLNDIMLAKKPSDPIPYDYGKFDNRFPNGFPTSGAFDLESGKLFLLHRAATKIDGGGHPIISVYEFKKGSAPNPPSDLSISIQ